MTNKPSNTPPQPTRTAYLVLGMHRSGTSALANLLALAGADLPRDVMPADEHNARGYFEPWRIAVFNDRRLAAAGSAWDDPFAALAPPPADEDTWREEARGLFRAQFGRRRRPLLKDPRVSVLASLWRSVLEAEGLALRVLIPIRHPLAVAGSLAKRDSFSARKSVMVWCAYMLAAEAASRDLPRAFVDYDALLEDWRPQIAAAEAQLGEPLPALTATAGRKIDAFLSTELRRNAPGGDLSALGPAGDMAAGVLDWLTAAVRSESPERAPLDRAAAWLADQKALYGDLVSPVSADRSLARTALADAEGRAAFLEQTVEETRQEGELRAAFLEKTVEETRQEGELRAAFLEKTVEETRQEGELRAAFLEKTIEETRQEGELRAAFLEKTIEETRQEGELRAAFLEQTLKETREIVATLEARIQSLYGTIGDMKDHVDSLTRTCKDLRTHARRLETQLEASQAAVREAAGRLEGLMEPG